MRKILITGASSEIGKAICDKLVSNGDFVMLQYYKNSSALGIIKERLGSSCQIISTDFNDSSLVDELCENVRKSEIDILINVATVTKTGLLPSITDEDIMQMVNVNNITLVKITRAIIPGMAAKRCGCIVNISSVAATRGNKGQSVYAGTKGFIESFTRSLSAEYASKGVRINCVAPGPVGTGSLTELLNIAPEELKQSIASRRLGKPEDIGNIVKFLCSEEAKFINGKCIAVDGGFMRGV